MKLDINRFWESYYDLTDGCPDTKSKEEVFEIMGKFAADFSVNNDALVDFIVNNEDRKLAFFTLDRLLTYTLDEYIGVNPAIQDKLSWAHVDFKRAIPRYYEQYSEVSKEDMEKAQDAVYDATNLLADIYNHEEIGRRLGFEGMKLGVYDALVSAFHEGFEPRTLDLAEELYAWIEEHDFDAMSRKEQEKFCKDYVQKVEALAKKHDVRLWDEDLTLNYIGLDMYNWTIDETNGSEERN